MSMKKKRNQSTLKADIYDQLLADDVKQGVDIVSLFASFGVKLTQKGSSFIGHCPFHADEQQKLSVDQVNGKYHCFDCGESGDVISLVQKMKGLDFKAAMDYLKNNAPAAEAALPEAQKSEARAFDVDKIADYYHHCLFHHEATLGWLERKGLTNSGLYSHFKLGYADGTLLDKVSQKGLEQLKQSGLVDDEGKEVFKDCLVFPLLSENGQVIALHGQSIHGGNNCPFVYPSGLPVGVFNQRACQVYQTIIITQGLLDCLSLFQMGVENCLPVFGVKGFGSAHLQALQAGSVQTIVLAFKGDESGLKEAEALKEQLLRDGFSVQIIFPHHFKDWNEALLNGMTKDEMRELISRAPKYEPSSGAKENCIYQGKKNHEHVFKLGEISYRIAGVKDVFIQHLKVNIKAQRYGDYFSDSIDLLVHRSRQSYAAHLSGLFGIESIRVEKDLLGILFYLEKMRDEKLTDQRHEHEIIYSDEEKEAALGLLGSADLAEQTIADISRAGYLGEDAKKLLVYLVGLSRHMPSPLSVYARSDSGTGKSSLIEVVLQFFPDTQINQIGSSSDQAFAYLPESDFKGKIFVMGECQHSPIVENYIRQMQSEHRLTRAVVCKDEKSGEAKTIKITHEVQLTFMTTSTKSTPNIENLSRCVLVEIDDSRLQTREILEMQRQSDDYEQQAKRKYEIPRLLRKHIVANLLLNKIQIYNPYARYIHFPSFHALFRRIQPHFLTLIKTVCYWRQYQKSPVFKPVPGTDKEEEWYACDLEDYRIARQAFLTNSLMSYVLELPEAMVEFYNALREMVGKKAIKEGLHVTEVTFIKQEVFELTRLKNSSIKRYLKLLTDYEYLQVVSGKRQRTRFSYCLRRDVAIKQENIVHLIPTVEELKGLIEADQG